MSKYGLILIAALSCLILVSGDDSKDDVDHMEHLLLDLHKGYQRYVPPRNLSIAFGINYLCAVLDERTSLLTSRVFERYKWVDSRLAWDPEKYGGIELVHVPAKFLWLPDNTRALNSIGEFLGLDEDITVVVDHDGLVYWFPLADYKTFCTKSPTYRTDHTYHCEIEFGPWSQGVKSHPMKLLFAEGVEIDDSIFHDQCPYEIGEHTTEFSVQNYECCPEPFHVLGFKFNLHRRGWDKWHKPKKEEPKKDKNCVWPHC
jgi:hypothetical protein